MQKQQQRQHSRNSCRLTRKTSNVASSSQMVEEASEGAPLGAPGPPPTQSNAVEHLSAARVLVREAQNLLREKGRLHTGDPSVSFHSQQLQSLMNVYQLCDQALMHLDFCGLPLGPLRGQHQNDSDLTTAARRRLQQELPDGMEKAGKAQGFFALVTMAEALRAMGKLLLGL